MPTQRSLLLASCLLAFGTGCDQVRGLLGQDAPAETADAAAKAPAEGKAPADAKAAAEPVAADAKADAPTADAEPTPAADAEAAPVADAEPSPAADAAAQPCVIGRWDAIDYSAAVERAIAKDSTLRGMKRTSSGGHVAYVLAPPEAGKGVITATADALTYAFSGKVQGFSVSAKVTIDGETVADYELVGTDGIRIAKPTKNTMKAKVAASVKGVASAKDNKSIDLDFDGSFVFDCTEETLEVWRGTRSKARPMSFRRAPAEAK